MDENDFWNPNTNIDDSITSNPDIDFFVQTDTALNPSFNGWERHAPINKINCMIPKGRVTLLAFDKTIKWTGHQ